MSSDDDALRPSSLVETLLRKAQRATQRGQASEAATLYRRALRIDPDCAQAVLGLLGSLAESEPDAQDLDEIRRLVDVAALRDYVETRLSGLERQQAVPLEDARLKQDLRRLYEKLELGEPKF